jgi:hypothetical protein
VANAAWTDMSVFSTELEGFQQFIFTARKVNLLGEPAAGSQGVTLQGR